MQPDNLLPFKRPEPLDSTLALSEAVRAQGNMHLAAERVSKILGVKVGPGDLVLAIASDPTSEALLSSQLRIMTAMHSFELLGELQVALKASIPDLEPYEVSKAFSSVAALIQSLTNSQSAITNVNITEVVMKMLPPEARSALLELTATDDNDPA